MHDEASLITARTELEYLRVSGALNPAQFQSITAQLPHDGKQSAYTDARYMNGGQVLNANEISKAAQNPEHPAHPDHPKHHEWAAKLGRKLGNAAVFGSGATVGSDLVHGVGL